MTRVSRFGQPFRRYIVGTDHRRRAHRTPRKQPTGQCRWRAKKRRQAIFGLNRDPAARRVTPKREDLDFWPTPLELRAALTEKVLPALPPGTIWECAAGDGVLATTWRPQVAKSSSATSPRNAAGSSASIFCMTSRRPKPRVRSRPPPALWQTWIARSFPGAHDGATR